jgi:multiple sugar transport system permease protein
MGFVSVDYAAVMAGNQNDSKTHLLRRELIMRKLNFGSQVIIYFLLIAGALLFSMPLLWMLSTALKPIEQTMSLPPTWLPYRYYAQIEGKEIPVKLRRKIAAPAYLLKTSDGKTCIAAKKLVKDGKLTVSKQQTVPVTIIREIPASKKAMYLQVIPETDTEKLLVPAQAVTRKVYFRWSNFVDAIKAMRYFPQYLRNTLLLCFLTVLGTVTSSALAAYGFSRIEWFGRDKVFLLLMATMMIPFPVIMVPMYCLFRYLGLIGTMTPLWIGSFCAGAFNVFLLRQFFIGLPQALSDAARIDGCNEFQIFWNIILPMSKPALMVVGLFQFMGTWNDFLGPLLYLTDQKDYTLALGLQFFQSQSGGTEWNYLMAASALIVIPVIVLFFFTQKSFIEGISTTGVKG